MYERAMVLWCCAGLNYQIEHHLFPRMCSLNYPSIQPIVRSIAEKHGVRYHYYPHIWENFWSTLSYLQRAGEGANWKELAQPLSGKN